MIRFESVCKDFEGLRVLENVDLDIPEGRIVGVVGPSGSGKTTMLKLITGILAPDSGVVRVATDQIGYVFQEARLLPWRTALDNVAVVLRAQGWAATEARQTAATWLAQVGLEGFEGYHPAELSGGMAQRVSIARAFAAEPKVLLLDEPFSNMDRERKLSLLALLEEIIRRQRTTVVYVTHELTEALQLADRIVALTGEHGLHELDLTNRTTVAEEWLASSVAGLEWRRLSGA
jgi:NitT/TauT family transport system ATP-binding protein